MSIQTCPYIISDTPLEPRTCLGYADYKVRYKRVGTPESEVNAHYCADHAKLAIIGLTKGNWVGKMEAFELFVEPYNWKDHAPKYETWS